MIQRIALTTLVALFIAAPVPAAAQQPAPLTDSLKTIHLLSRATFGVRDEDLAVALKIGREKWLDRQLHPEQINDAALDDRLSRFPAANMSVAEMYRQFPPPQIARRIARERGDTTRSGQREIMRQLGGGMRPQRLNIDLVSAKLNRAVYSERQLQQVMTNFWFNHFNVFIGKGQDRYLVGDYEKRAIEPYVFGKFEDMLVATARHPAMLYFLDNWMSAVVDTLSPQYLRRQQMVQRAGGQRRKPGINENYARELMELHTLGVDGGYTQQDVINVARAFTGWTIRQPNLGRAMRGARQENGMIEMPDIDAPEYVFRREMHDPADKVVLGQKIRATGEDEGREILHMLARHPATARHIATKLAVRFVSDDPPKALVDRLAAVFLKTDGDLREVTRAVFTSPEFYDGKYYRVKVKTPLEVVTSALRATDADMSTSRVLLQTLRTLGEFPYQESAPTGYPASSDEWVNSGAMLNRMNFALSLADGRVDGVHPSSANSDIDAMLRTFVPGADTRTLKSIVQRDPARAAGLILGSPEFQKK